MDVAFSPCPNDTFLFWAWVHGYVGSPITPHLADIQTLNEWAFNRQYAISKVSIAAAGRLLDDYAICRAGAALGFGCGPKLIAKFPFSLKALSEKSVAIPGRNTTAHQLFDQLCPAPASKHFCRYHEAPSLLALDIVDAAVIIHEHRFTFESMEFVEIADIGSLWEQRYNTPVPLGCLIVRRDAEDPTATIQSSLAQARRHFNQALPYILEHSQDLSPAVVRQHIETYVNDESHHLSKRGIDAISQFLNLSPEQWLY